MRPIHIFLKKAQVVPMQKIGCSQSRIFPSRVAINPDTKFSFFCLLYVIGPKFYRQEDQVAGRS